MTTRTTQRRHCHEVKWCHGFRFGFVFFAKTLLEKKHELDVLLNRFQHPLSHKHGRSSRHRISCFSFYSSNQIKAKKRKKKEYNRCANNVRSNIVKQLLYVRFHMFQHTRSRGVIFDEKISINNKSQNGARWQLQHTRTVTHTYAQEQYNFLLNTLYQCPKVNSKWQLSRKARKWCTQASR